MKLSKRLVGWLAVPALLLIVSAVPSQDASKPPLSKGDAAGGTVKVQKGLFQANVTLKGTFAAAEAAEIVLRPEAWGTGLGGGGLIVQTAVEHGAPVKKGETLIQLQTDKIDRAIRDLEAEVAMSQLALRLAAEELPALEKSTPLDLAAADRARTQAEEDLKKFLEVDQILTKDTAENMLKNAEYFLQYAEEELKQLQKMYRSKDLTEETEEIILKRQKHQVEMAKFQVRSSRNHRDQTIKIDLPRREQNARDSAAKAAISQERTRATLPLLLNQKRLSLEKLQHEFDKTSERLANLKKDRELMTIKAPADGIAYHGRCVKGQWNSGTVTPRMQRSGALMAEEVILTVVSPRPLVVHANVDEKDLHLLKVGAKGKAVPAGYPDVHLPVELSSLSAVPQSAGSFAAVFKVDAAHALEEIVPGMACTIKVAAFRKESALTLPSSAIFSDDDEEHYVYRAGSKEKVSVKVGKSANDRTEIVEGLKEGDAVLTSKP